MVLGGIAGCSNGGVTIGGPLSRESGEGVFCAPVEEGGSLTFGYQSLKNSGTDAVEITEVSLAEPSNLRLVAAYVTPLSDHQLVGVWAGYPPPTSEMLPAARRNWDDRVDAEGASIEAGEELGLVPIVELGGRSGSAAGIQIDYRVRDSRYRYTTTIRIELRIRCGA
jgi:hypothetical protein